MEEESPRIEDGINDAQVEGQEVDLPALSLRYLRALKYFRMNGGIAPEPPLTEEEYGSYDANTDSARNDDDLSRYSRRVGYFSARQRVEALEKELRAAGIEPQRAPSDFVKGLPDSVREAIYPTVKAHNL